MTEIKIRYIIIIMLIIGFIIMSLIVVWLSARIFDNIESYMENLIRYIRGKLP